MPRVRILAPFIFLTSLILISVWLDRPYPRADVVYANTSENFTLDPQRLSYQHDVRTSRSLFEGLVNVNGEHGTPEAAVAMSWQRSEDGRTWTYHLRDDARWSNGAPVTSHDFMYAWRRAILPDLAADYTGFFLSIEGAKDFFEWRVKALAEFALSPGGADAAGKLWKETESRFATQVGLSAPDDHTLVVKLARPVAYWLDLCAFPAMFPVYPPLVESFTRINPRTAQLEQDPGWTKGGVLVSNGPYQLVQWRPKRSMRFEKNPYYWNAANVPSQTIESIPIEDPNTAVLAFENGDIDWLTDTIVEYRGDMFDEAKRGQRENLHVLDAFGTDFFSFNCRPKLADGRTNPFANPAVRRAFTLAVDKTTIVNNITRLDETVATTFIPPDSIPDYQAPAGLAFDPIKARAELADAGWRDRDNDGVVENESGEKFPTVEIMYSAASPRYRDMAGALSAMWSETLHIQSAPRSRDPLGFKDALKQGDFMIARGGWYGDYGDPTTWLDLCRTGDGNNDRKYACPEFDALLDKAANELDPARRFQILQDAERIITERDLPMIPICHYVTVYMYEPARLTGLSRHPRLEQYLGRLQIKK
jgi:oligopeptide transport system substrate-binding protein